MRTCSNIFYIALASLLMLACTTCFAQEVLEKKKTEWDSKLTLGFNLTEGNSDTTLLTLGAKAEREKSKDIWRFEAEHKFGETDDKTNIDDSTALAEYKHLLSDRLYLGLGLDAKRDEIADVKYRVTTNPVVGYFLIKNNEVRFNVEAGPSYLFEEVGNIEDDYLAPRFAERLVWQISDTAKIFEEAECLISAEDSNNYIIEAEAGIEATLTSVLSLILSLKNKYDNQPSLGLERNDLSTTTALAYKF